MSELAAKVEAARAAAASARAAMSHAAQIEHLQGDPLVELLVGQAAMLEAQVAIFEACESLTHDALAGDVAKRLEPAMTRAIRSAVKPAAWRPLAIAAIIGIAFGGLCVGGGVWLSRPSESAGMGAEHACFMQSRGGGREGRASNVSGYCEARLMPIPLCVPPVQLVHCPALMLVRCAWHAARPKVRALKGEKPMPVGTVKWFNAQKGYGFIQPDGGSKDVFVHISEVERSGLGALHEGSRISFEIERGERGKTFATNLKNA